MFWFEKRKAKIVAQDELAKEVEIDVKAHKAKTAKVVAQGQKIVDNFNKVLEENGITIRIHATAGGKRH